MKRDWEGIEADYRTGQLANRGLATKYNVPESTIRSRANSYCWMRDLSTDVQRATQAKLSRALRSKTAHLAAGDRGIVEQASNYNTSLIFSHRQSISRWRHIVERLVGALEVIEISEDNHTEVSRSVNNGIDALGKAIKLEREAYNMDSKQNEAPDNRLRQISDEELDARVDELLRVVSI